MIKRFFTVSVVVLTIFWAVGLAAFIPTAQATTFSTGDLIKASTPAVYYYGSDGKRYVFPNEKTYMTWYPNFSGVKTITDAELAAITIGGNVTMRPGVKLAKITTDPKVYAVGANGTLRWVTTADIATCLYGATWSTLVQDVSDAFFVNYTSGAAINACADFSPSAITAAASSINVDKGLSSGTVGALNVALSSASPAAASVPAGAASPASDVLFTKLVVAAGPADVTISKIAITRSGLSTDADLAAVKLYDGANELGTAQTFNASHKAVFNLTNALAISANTSKTIDVKADLTGGATGIISLGLAAASDVTSSAAVSGIFPIYGNQMTEVATNVGSLTLADGTQQPTAGGTVDIDKTNMIFFQAKLTAGAVEDVKVTSIIFRKGNNATFLDTDISNIKINNDTDAASLGTGTIVNSNVVVDLSANPLIITKGHYKEVSLRADVVGGSGRLVGFDINDGVSWTVQAQGMTYGYGINYLAGAWFSAVNGQGPVTTINQGTVNVSKSLSSPATGNIGIGGTEIPVATFDFAVRGEDVRIGSSGLEIATNLGTDAAAIANVSNVKIVDSTGAVLAGPVNPVAFGANDGIVAVPFTTNYTLPAGTDKVTVEFDLAAAAAPASTYQVFVNSNVVTVPASAFANVRGLVSNKVIVPTPAGLIPANIMSAQGAALTADFGSTPITGRVIAGSKDYIIGYLGLDATAGGENVKITSITVTQGGTAVIADYNNCKLTNIANSAQVGVTTQPVAGATPLTFTLSDPLIVNKGTVTTLAVTCDVLSTATPNNTFIFGIVGGGSITAVGAVTGAVVAKTIPATPTPTKTIKATGSLKVAIDAGTPAAKALVASSTGNEVVKYKFTAVDEIVDVTKLNVWIGDTTVGGVPAVRLASNVSYVSAYVDGILVGTAVPTNNTGYMTINVPSGTFKVDTVTPKTLTLKVDMFDKNQLTTGTTIGGGTGGIFQAGLAGITGNNDATWTGADGYDVVATGISSGLAIANINTTGAPGGLVNGGNLYSVHDGILQVSLNSASPSGAAGQEMIRFNLKAVNDDILVDRLELAEQDSVGLAMAGGNNQIIGVADGRIYGTVAGACDANAGREGYGTGGGIMNAWAIPVSISAGNTLVLKYVCGTTNSTANSTIQVSIAPTGPAVLTRDGMTYSAVDGVVVGGAGDVTPIDGLPLQGNVLRF